MALPGSTAPVAEKATPSAIAVTDAEGTITGWTAAAERLLGYAAGDAVGRPLHLILGPGRAAGDGRPHLLDEGEGEGADRTGFVEARHRDGRRIPLLLRLTPITAAGGKYGSLVSAAPLEEPEPNHAARNDISASLLGAMPLAIRIWDRNIRCVWLNDTAEGVQGIPRREQLGRGARDILRGFDADAVEQAIRRVLDTGTPLVDHEFLWTSPNGRSRRSISMTFFRLEGSDGLPFGVCSLAVDISRSWTRERLSLLNQASTRVGSTLDVMTTAQELADLAIGLLADYVTVDLADTVPLGDEPLPRLAGQDPTGTRIPVFRRAGVASIHADLSESLWRRGEAVYVPSASPFTHVLDSGQPHFEPRLDTSPGTWLDRDPDRARVIHETGMHSLIVVPLQARGEILGVAVFVRIENPRPFDRDDLLLAEELGVRAALSLDNARRYTRERTAALALQQALLPRHVRCGGSVEIASRYIPANIYGGVGGDWYDVFALRDSRVALVVGDVVGHGINAAATMGQLRTAVRTLAYVDKSPDEVLAHLDELVARVSEEDGGPADGDVPRLAAMGATCLYAVYDGVTRRCTMARAGHPPPAIADPGGRVSFPELPTGVPIGLGLGTFESVEFELPEGSVIALYTDGLVETRGADIDVGLGQLRTALSRPGLPLEELCSAVVDTAIGGGRAEDDVALLLARTHPAGRHTA
ncbi:SpoIIE family protein phosphatase [Streptomyces hoynatensis]|uniref:protein-serine/threonine phosphatase n=1 Tax=Streptomyces hoynatensis TaxID=1141874 RepID=A0A3A9YVJ3_9ACTN|nr:SpoIIE family protein phosphatase [Streptomyces hoynatensis]RKN40068.1 PAS domain-containing protein [Streptomyces hoynatensis]